MIRNQRKIRLSLDDLYSEIAFLHYLQKALTRILIVIMVLIIFLTLLVITESPVFRPGFSFMGDGENGFIQSSVCLPVSA
jgi:hypothetical protein